MHSFDGPVTAVEAQPVPRLSAHRLLVDATLRVAEPGGRGPLAVSYVELWQNAATEQRAIRAGTSDASDQMVEQALELLVTELRALSPAVEWFESDSGLRAAAIEETIGYWAADLTVPSAVAHTTWARCWQSRMAALRHIPVDGAALDAAAETRQQLQREWVRQWQLWAERMAG